MLSLERLEYLIELDGGVCHGNHLNHLLGWDYSRPSPEEIEAKEADYGISYCAAKLLHAYAATTFRRINSALIQSNETELPEFERQFTISLNQALDELPEFSEELCYRGDNLPKEGTDFLKSQIGKVFQIPSFWSTFASRNDDFGDLITIQPLPKNTNGRYINPIVKKDAEDEVLFKSGSLFHIAGVFEGNLMLNEVENVEPDFVLYENFWEKYSD